jgi:hypothetical protein
VFFGVLEAIFAFLDFFPLMNLASYNLSVSLPQCSQVSLEIIGEYIHDGLAVARWPVMFPKERPDCPSENFFFDADA